MCKREQVPHAYNSAPTASLPVPLAAMGADAMSANTLLPTPWSCITKFQSNGAGGMPWGTSASSATIVMPWRMDGRAWRATKNTRPQYSLPDAAEWVASRNELDPGALQRVILRVVKNIPTPVKRKCSARLIRNGRCLSIKPAAGSSASRSHILPAPLSPQSFRHSLVAR